MNKQITPPSIVYNTDGTVMSHEYAVVVVESMLVGTGGVYMRDGEITGIKSPHDDFLIDGQATLQDLKALILVLEHNLAKNTEGEPS